MKKILLILFSSLAIFSSCEDENTEIITDTESNEVTYFNVNALVKDIDFPEATHGVKYTYTIDEITDSLLNLYDFRWEESVLSGDTLTIYSEGASLVFTPETATDYNIRLVAISKDDRFYSYSNEFTITVESVASSSVWFLVGEYGGEYGLSLVFPNLTNFPNIIHNIYTDIPANATKIDVGCSTSKYSGSSSYFDEHSIIIEGETESVLLGSEYPFKIVSTLKDNIVDAEDDFLYHSYFHGNSQGFLISKSGGYYTKVKEDGHQYNYESKYVKTPFMYEVDGVEQEVKVTDNFCEFSDLVNSNSTFNICLILESQDGKRFVRTISDETNDFTVEEYSSNIAYSGEDAATGIDFDDLGDWELVYSYYNTASYIYCMFRRDSEVKIVRVYKKVSGSSTNYISVNTKTFPNPELIDDATRYVCQESNNVFFSKGNMLYKYSFDDNAVTTYYSSLPEGEVVTAMTTNCLQSEMLVGTDKGTLALINIAREDDSISDAVKLTYEIPGFTRIDGLGYKWATYYSSIFGGSNFTSSSYAD